MSDSEPNVWCLLGRKAGDNTQVLALAEALNVGFTEKHIAARHWELIPHLLFRVTLAGIDRAVSSELAPPWPDLVITAGRRNEPVARWIRRQSGGLTRLVHIGRPWAPLDTWDLIVTTPQYFLPERANICHNRLPLFRLPEQVLNAAGEALRPRLAQLPRPWVAVLVGGDSGKYVFTADKGARLGQWADRLAASARGSLLVCGSPRTPAPAMRALETVLEAPHFLYRWGSADENPYRGVLALADAFIVTGESMSMLAEASGTGKPLYIFDPGDGEVSWWRVPHSYRYKPLSHYLAMRLGPVRMRRDVGRIQAALVGGGQAEWLGPASRYRQGGSPVAPQRKEDELDRTAARVRRLLESR